MAGRITRGPLGKPNHAVQFYWGNAVLSRLQYWNGNPCWSGRSNTTSYSRPAGENDILRRQSLDLTQEKRDQAMIRLGIYQQRVAKYYNSKVRHRSFKADDLVLGKVFQNTQEVNSGKLDPTWEGPYRVTSIPRVGAYRLQSLDGKDVPRSWNSVHLRRYYL